MQLELAGGHSGTFAEGPLGPCFHLVAKVLRLSYEAKSV